MADSVLRVILKGDAAQLNSSLRTASQRLDAFGSKMQSVASSLRSVSIPLAIAGGAAVKMAAGFDKSMTQIKSLVGVAGDEVDAMGEKVKQMANDTAVNANDGAEALFFITSAGLRGAEAMDVLEASMKAAAIGLGETKTVADLATSAMNAYGSDVLSATDATDVMVSAVREGKLEASELAGSMGRVLPVASAMGVRFDEVGAAFAALSRTGTNAAEAATQIRGILTSLLKPTKEASDTLASMGLSTEGLRQQIKEEGLLAALETLKSNFEGNDDAAQKVFGNVRALSGIMDLLGANVDTTRSIFDSMTKSAGATDTAFKTLQESTEYKLRKSITELKNSFQETGTIILEAVLPHIKSLSDSIQGLFKDFQELDEDTQKAYIRLGEIIVVAPLVVGAIGTITTAVGGLTKAIQFLTGEKVFGLITSGLSKVTATFGLAVLAYQEFLQKTANINTTFLESLDLFIKGLTNKKAYIEALYNVTPLGRADAAVKAEDAYTESLKGQEEQANATAAALDKLLKQEAPKPKTPTQIITAPSKAEIDNRLKISGFKDINDYTAFEKLHGYIFLIEDDLNTLKYKSIETAKALDKMLSTDSSLTHALAVDAASIEYFGDIVESTAEDIEEPLESIKESIEEATDGVSNFALIIGRDLANAFGKVLEGDAFFKTMIETLKDLAKQLIATAAAAALLALFTGKSFGKVFNSLSGINLFGSKNAGNGGRIGTPSGTGLGTIPANIIPNNSMNLTGQFRLDGQDLVVAFERANKQRANFITG